MGTASDNKLGSLMATTEQNQAHRMLSDIYNWFTEGFETKDLQEAKALLEGLSGKKYAILLQEVTEHVSN